MLLAPSTDADAINAVINHPAVRPHVGFVDAGDLDVTPLIRPENLFPFGEHGGFALIWTAPRTAEVHTFVLPKGRGKWAKEAAAEMIWMAAERGLERLWTKIPPDAPHVSAYATAAGMKPTGETVEQEGKAFTIMSLGTASCR